MTFCGPCVVWRSNNRQSCQNSQSSLYSAHRNPSLFETARRVLSWVCLFFWMNVRHSTSKFRVFGVFLDELKCTFIGIDHLFVLRSGFTPLSCNCSEVNDVDGTSISLQFTALTGMDGLHCVWSSSFPIQLHFDATRRMNC